MVDTRFFESIGKIALSDLLSQIPMAHAGLTKEQLAMPVSNAATLETAISGHISFASQKKYIEALQQSSASVVFVTKELVQYVPDSALAITFDAPHLAFVAVLEFMFPKNLHHLAHRPTFEHLEEPQFEEGVVIGQNAVIGSAVQIGSGSIIGPNSVIAAGVAIGRNVIVGDNVTIECSLIGDDVVIGSGARVGAKGFGWLDHGKSNRAIPQLGRVIVQSGVEIGANSNIDRGALGDTIIGENTKIGALVEIGHNSNLGRNCLIAPMSGLAGGTVLEDSVLMGANSACVGHMKIGAGSIIHARAAASKDWPAGSMLAGAPAQDIKEYWRQLAALRKLGKGAKK